MGRSFEIALRFLTVFPIKVQPEPDMEEVGRSAWAFPLVGAVIGAILVLFQWIIGDHVPLLLSGVLLTALWVSLSGGLHLDGWTDCCDAIFASVPRERRLEILKDSRLGAFGAIGLFFLLGAKVAAVGSGFAVPSILLLAPVVGRGAQVLVAHNSPRAGEGMGNRFTASLTARSVAAAGLLVLLSCLVVGWRGLAAGAAGLIAAFGMRRVALSQLGTVNGDVLGACCELAEAAVLVVGVTTW